MLDKEILATVVASRDAYNRIKDYFKDSDASPQVAFWLKLVREYYERDAACTHVDFATLRALGEAAIPNPKHTQSLLAVIEALPGASPANVVQHVLDLRRYNLSAEFAAASMAKDMAKANKLLNEINIIWERTTLTDTAEVEYAKGWDEIDSVVGRDNRVPLGIGSLDSRIGGGALPGHHILVFGRTEVGKTCLTIALTANLIRQGQSVLYAGNEESVNVLKARLRCSILQQPQVWIDEHPKKALRRLMEYPADKLVMVGVTPGSISELEDLTAKHSPTILVIDQIRNLAGSEDGITQRMEHNASRLRSLLNKNHLIGITVTQAGDRSQGHNQSGPIYLSAGDVDSSRVGLPGTCDLMLGVGGSQDMLSRGLRMISLCKNKLSSAPGAREPLMLRFDFQRSMVTGE